MGLSKRQDAVIRSFSKTLAKRKVPLCCLVNGEHKIAEGRMCADCLSAIIGTLAAMLLKDKKREQQP